ncbi:MAG: exodeoxyribonuclease VII large subunit [Calditrichaceae bacterium]|nr:exodeoxyribonuclease VII large subunit [Calditrichaceae bacterium]MBN2708830.1 exodeoxyribonuclease VII large subunit [Calditrichaceae bacterium]RQV97641.1 MAG: exodeoxyribonuclease VII large subunit [Calditrichota bacterium]
MLQAKIYSVAEVTRTIKLLLEENIPTLWIEGEISNFKAHYSGHLYFTLKDENAQISAVMWQSRANQLPFKIEDGLKIQALGNIRVFEKSGRYQIDIIKILPAGLGQLQMEFENLKKRLAEAGLFDEQHKKPLPSYPEKIGLITSPTGAAVRDMINVLQRRAPHINIIIRPTQVQGKEAYLDIVRAIEEFNEFQDVDLLIIGRGGGSIEDLWAFNEEAVAKAIFNSKIPVISAVGHEIDFTIADFVADLRAPTPSAAAELAVPDYNEIKTEIINIRERITFLISDKITRYREKLNHIRRSYGIRRPEDMMRQYAQHLDNIVNRFNQSSVYYVDQLKSKIDNLSVRLQSINPENVLRRGYSITYFNGNIIKSAKRLKPDQQIETRLAEGKISSIIDKIEGE